MVRHSHRGSSMTERQKRPPLSLVSGMSKEEKAQFTKTWQGARWLSDPIREGFERRRVDLLQELVYCYAEASPDEDLKSEIRVIDAFLSYLP